MELMVHFHQPVAINAGNVRAIPWRTGGIMCPDFIGQNLILFSVLPYAANLLPLLNISGTISQGNLVKVDINNL